MAHVISIKVDGLLGRKDSIHYKLNRDVNVFFGENGSGKTSLLKIIHSAMNNNPSVIASIKFTRAEVEIYSINFSKSFRFILDRGERSAHSPKEDIFELDEDHKLVGEKWKIIPRNREMRRFRHVYLATSRLYGNLERGSLIAKDRVDQMDSEALLNQSFARAMQNLWSIHFGNIVKKVSSVQEVGLQRVLEEALAFEDIDSKALQNEIDPNIAFKSMSRFLERQSNIKLKKILGIESEFSSKYKNNHFLRKIVNHIVKVESEIDNAMRPLNEVAAIIQSLFSRGKKLSLNGPQIEIRSETNDNIDLADLSSGEKHLIMIFLRTLLIEENTLIIDEPEISMHIDWQRNLVGNLLTLNPNCQLIMATHSPEIMAKLPDEHIFKI